MMVYRGKRNGGGCPRQDGPNQGKNGNGKSNSKKWTAPTANHHDIAFSAGTRAKDAAEFTDTVRILARHVSTSSTYKHGPVLALAMTDLKAPVYTEPPRPVRKYVCKSDNSGATIVTNRMTAGKLNEPVDDDFDWSIETGSLSLPTVILLVTIVGPKSSDLQTYFLTGLGGSV